MMLIDGLFQVRTHDVCVDLGGSDVSMAEHGLHTAKVRAALQQMSSEGMPQNVRAQRMEDTGFFSVQPQQLPESLPGHAGATRRHEQVGRNSAAEQGWTLADPVSLRRLEGRSSHWD